MYHTRHKGHITKQVINGETCYFIMETSLQTSLLFLSQKKETNFPRLVYQFIKNIILKSLKKSGESQTVKEGLLKIYLPFYQACIVLSLQITVLVLRLRIETTLY